MLHSLKKRIVMHKKWLFPCVLLAIFFFLVAFKINGSSIGIYHDYFYGKGSKDPQLLYGQPQPIRSDEWLVATQMTIAQAKDNFAENNSNVNGNENLGLILDVPYKDWSSVFKPQYLAFFVIPLEYAFAFKWWFLLFTLLLSSYFFFLKILSNKVTLSILASIIISCSPFVFWWYQTATTLPFTYGFLILLLGMSIVDKTSLSAGKAKLNKYATIGIKIGALSYLLTSFALILYPPFQIPVALVVAFFLAGYFMKQTTHTPFKKRLLYILLPFLISGVITGGICGLYVLTRIDSVKAVTNTIYPGKRDIPSGGYDVRMLLVNYLQPKLQDSKAGPNFYQNQSESSNFILLPIFFTIPIIWLFLYLYIKRHIFEWVIFGLLLCNLLFLAHLFLPMPSIFGHVSLLYLVPLKRLVFGLGFIAIILVVYTISILPSLRLPPYRKILVYTTGYSLIFLAVSILAGISIIHDYPNFIHSKKLVIFLASLIVLGMSLTLVNRPKLGLSILAILSLVSVYAIHPLYIGLGPLYNSALTEGVQAASKPNDVWAAASDLYIENIPQISDRPAITGVSPYPDMAFWRQYSGANNEGIYNRYAHIVMVNNDKPINLVQPDLFTIAPTCTPNMKHAIDHVISSDPLQASCLHLAKTINLPARSFYIYDVVKS